MYFWPFLRGYVTPFIMMDSGSPPFTGWLIQRDLTQERLDKWPFKGVTYNHPNKCHSNNCKAHSFLSNIHIWTDPLQKSMSRLPGCSQIVTFGVPQPLASLETGQLTTGNVPEKRFTDDIRSLEPFTWLVNLPPSSKVPRPLCMILEDSSSSLSFNASTKMCSIAWR